MSRAGLGIVVTCEHASRAVPPGLAPRFRGCRKLLASHRGHDAGALAVARVLARAFDAPLFQGAVTRLAIDLNRSLDHPAVLGAPLRSLPRPERARLLSRLAASYWRPFRRDVRAALARAARSHGAVLHLSIHSFTPVLDGRPRTMDVGVLYDPARPFERRIAAALADGLARTTGLAVARNRPYRGTSDGHTTALRRDFEPATYAGLEVELNQRLLRSGRFPAALVRALVGSITEVRSRADAAHGADTGRGSARRARHDL